MRRCRWSFRWVLIATRSRIIFATATIGVNRCVAGVMEYRWRKGGLKGSKPDGEPTSSKTLRGKLVTCQNRLRKRAASSSDTNRTPATDRPVHSRHNPMLPSHDLHSKDSGGCLYQPTGCAHESTEHSDANCVLRML